MKEESSVVMLADPIIEPVIEPIVAPATVPKARLLSRVYIWLRLGGDKYWGTVASLGRARVTVCTHARFKLNTKVVIRFHFQIADKYVVTEELEAKVMWQSGDSAALEFTPALSAGSPALQAVPHLKAHFAAEEAKR